MSRSRSRRSASMSASQTGESLPLVQLRIGAPNFPRASAPASRTASASRSASSARGISASLACNGQPLHPDGRRIDAVTESEIVGRHEGAEDVGEMTRDRDLAHRIGELAVLDPEAGGAAAVIAGHQVDAHANEIGDIKAFLDVSDQRIRRDAARLEVKIGRARSGRRRYAALRMSGRALAKLARGGAVEQPGLELAIVHDREARAGDALGVELARAQATPAQRIIDDPDAGRENFFAQLVLQEARLARDGAAADGIGEMANEPAGDARIE